MARFLVILLSVIVAAECFSFIKRQGEDEPVAERSSWRGCQGRVRECTVSNLAGLDVNEIPRDIDCVCDRIESFEACTTSVVESCQYLQYIVAYYSAGINFLCSDRGKALVRQYKHCSPCYNNPNRTNTLMQNIYTCVDERTVQPTPAEVKRTLADHCAFSLFQLPTFSECTVSVVTSTCGAVAGQLVTELLEAAAVVRNGCETDDVVSVNTKRELGSWFI